MGGAQGRAPALLPLSTGPARAQKTKRQRPQWTLPFGLVYWFDYLIKEKFATTAANTIETIESSLMRMLMDGPEVSLNGSPTVSPTTAALCSGEPLPPWWPDSMYFFALSQAPPELDKIGRAHV